MLLRMWCNLSGPVLRDTARLSQRYPPIACYGVFGVSTYGQLGVIPPSPFLNVFPLESMRSGGAIPPTKGVSQRYPMKTGYNARDTPLCDTISKAYCTIWGGISYWAAKGATLCVWKPASKSHAQKILELLPTCVWDHMK